MSQATVEVVKALFAAFADRDLVAATTVLITRSRFVPALSAAWREPSIAV